MLLIPATHPPLVNDSPEIKLLEEYYSIPWKLCVNHWALCRTRSFYLFGVLRRFQHCTGHITTGSWKGRGNQYIQFVRVLYCKLPTNGKQLPAFPPETAPGIEPRPQRWEARVLPLCHRGPPAHVLKNVYNLPYSMAKTLSKEWKNIQMKYLASYLCAVKLLCTAYKISLRPILSTNSS